jgi:collagenase-like PrtC family protease
MEMGATRWVAPIETTREIAQGVTAARPIEAEVFAHGRLPLAFSARCFTARRFNLQKEGCEYRCIGFPDGMPLRTREGAAFLTINGVQTQSALVYDLSRDIGSLKEAGVGIFRVSPQSTGTIEALESLRDTLDGKEREFRQQDRCNGFWHGRPGLERAA